MTIYLQRNDIQVKTIGQDSTYQLQIGPALLRDVAWYVTYRTTPDGPLQRQHGQIGALDKNLIRDVHDTGERMNISGGTNPTLHLETTVYDTRPMIGIRVGITNTAHIPLYIEELIPFDSRSISFGHGPLDGWVNGYHSWSFTGLVRHNERQPRMITHIVTRPHAENTGIRPLTGRGQYTGDWVGALIDPDHHALVAGYMGVEQQFGQIYADGRPGNLYLKLQSTADGMRLDPGQTLWGEWAALYIVPLPHPDPLRIYSHAVMRLTSPRLHDQSPTSGWSSWYQFFNKVTREDMDRNLEAVKGLSNQLPLRLVQLDDGYQPAWGDWLEHNEKFPGGVSAWAADVHAAGLEPGLWLSPFTVDRGSKVFKEHPEALIKNRKGNPVHGGFLVERWLHGLDPTHPYTKEYIQRVISTIVNEWGIRYLKLDFLYCGALPGVRYDPYSTRASAFRDGLRLIRDTAGEDVTLLGCGCPLGPAVGIVDVMRVSPDVAPTWQPEQLGLKAPFRNDWSLPATRNSLAVSINRSWTHQRWWWLDADNLLVREQQELTEDEVHTLANTVGMLSSHLIISDNLPHTAPDRLELASKLLPLMPEKRANVPGLFSARMPEVLVRRRSNLTGEYTLLMAANWQDKPHQPQLPDDIPGFNSQDEIAVLNFHDGIVETGLLSEWKLPTLPPHASRLYSLRKLTPLPAYLGSDLHISMGDEVKRWEISESDLTLLIETKHHHKGDIAIAAASKPTSVEVNGEMARTAISPSEQDEVIVFSFSVEGSGPLEIHITF